MACSFVTSLLKKNFFVDAIPNCLATQILKWNTLCVSVLPNLVKIQYPSDYYKAEKKCDNGAMEIVTLEILPFYSIFTSHGHIFIRGPRIHKYTMPQGNKKINTPFWFFILILTILDKSNDTWSYKTPNTFSTLTPTKHTLYKYTHTLGNITLLKIL